MATKKQQKKQVLNPMSIDELRELRASLVRYYIQNYFVLSLSERISIVTIISSLIDSIDGL